MFDAYKLAMKRFARADDGSATVEAVLILPLFLAIMALLFDASSMFHGEAKALRVLQDANRNMSIGRLETDGEVEAYIAARLTALNITTLSVDTTSNNDVVLTSIIIPARQFQLFGYFEALLNANIEITGAHIRESWDPSTFTSVVSTS